jgi:hypothetical protein
VRISERKTGSGAEINIQRNKNQNNDEHGEHDLAFRRHGSPPNWLGLQFYFSHPLDKTIDHALLAGAVELNRQLVAVDRGDVAVAEFLMKDAVAE